MSGKAFLSALITGLSNYAIQYNFQSAAIALIVMSEGVCTSTKADCKGDLQADWVSGSTTALVLLGAMTGQLTMGYLGDVIGRNMALLTTCSIATVFALLQAVAYGDPDAIYAQIIIFRFFLGVGVGGIYPLSATKAAEDGSKEPGKIDTFKAAKSFLWQYPGVISPWLLTYILVSKHVNNDTIWRVVYGVGAIPVFLSTIGLLIEYFLYGGTEDRSDMGTNLLTGSDVSDQSVLKEPSLDKHPKKTLIEQLKDPLNQRNLIATGGVWFLYDVFSYGVSLTAGQIIHDISKIDDDNVSSSENLLNITSKQCIAIACATLSTFIPLLTLPIIGLRNLQIISFALSFFFLLLFACLFNFLVDSKRFTDLFVLFIFVFMSINSGQNITTYLLPAALFPKEIRTTFNGIACAMAKFGAFLGAFTYVYIANASSFAVTAGISSVLALVALYMTYSYVDEESILRNSVQSMSRSSKLSALLSPRSSANSSKDSGAGIRLSETQSHHDSI